MKVINARTVLVVTKQAPEQKAMATQMLRMTGQPRELLPSDAECALVEKNSAKLDALENMPM